MAKILLGLGFELNFYWDSGSGVPHAYPHAGVNVMPHTPHLGDTWGFRKSGVPKDKNPVLLGEPQTAPGSGS